MTFDEFVIKYGTHDFSLPIKEFIRRAPEFPADKELAKIIGELMGDLESAALTSIR